jgi:hypothetical protein
MRERVLGFGVIPSGEHGTVEDAGSALLLAYALKNGIAPRHRTHGSATHLIAQAGGAFFLAVAGG